MACEGASSYALRTCPFLAQLAEREGPQVAARIASDPTRPARGPRPLLPEGEGLLTTFALFHGPEGVVPLSGYEDRASGLLVRAGGCPYAAAGLRPASTDAKAVVISPPGAAPALSLASMSMSFGPGGFGDFLRRHLKQQQLRRGREPPRPSRRAGPDSGGASNSSSGAGPSGRRFGGGSGVSGAASRAGPPGASGSGDLGSGTRGGGGGGASRGPPPPNSSSGLSSGAAASGAAGPAGSGGAAAAGGGCPMRRWLGPAAGIVFDNYGRLHCPEPIVAARAALARTAAVRTLRPKALPLKLLAVAATAAALNVPCGAVREHFEKFSLGWFVAVHATIPFVAMLRKAVVMPKLAIVVTIAAAVAGQMVGARLERARLAREAAAEPAAPPVAAAPPRGPALRRQAAQPEPLDTCAAAAAEEEEEHRGLEALAGQVSCAMASMTQNSPRQLQANVARLLSLPVTPLKV